MRFFLVEVFAWIGAATLMTLWLAFGEYLFPEPSLLKVAFMWGPALLFLADLVYMILKSKDD